MEKILVRQTRLHGAPAAGEMPSALSRYGIDAPAIEQRYLKDAGLRQQLDKALPYTRAEVIYAVREEMARTMEDVLSGRTRALFLDSAAALRSAPLVAEIMAKELGYGAESITSELDRFTKLAEEFYQVRSDGQSESVSIDHQAH